MDTNHNRIKVADLEKNEPNKILITDENGELEFNDVEAIGGSSDPVSATQPGIVDNTALQELGGVDKLINGIRIGKGSGSGNDNTILGNLSLTNLTTGSYNVGVGHKTLEANTTGSRNIAIGDVAMASNATGVDNVGIGDSALKVNSNGNYNVAIGTNCLSKNTISIANTGIGYNALRDNTVGNNNVAIGAETLRSNIYGYANVALGTLALRSNIGVQGSNVYGMRSIAIGSQAMFSNTTGNATAIGDNALYSQTTGVWNIAIGCQAGNAITTGSNNVIIAGTGFIARGGGITTGSNNLIISPNNGNTTGITTGSGNIVIGKVDGLPSDALNTITISDGSGNKRASHDGTNWTLKGKTNLSGGANVGALSIYNDNENAISAGLEVGDLYRTSAGQLMVRY